MKKSLLKTSVFGLTLLTAAMGLSAGQSFADGYSTQQQHHHHGRMGFMLGVCVGQTLAGEGITLPAPTPGQPPNLSATTRQAIHAAVKSCRAQFHGAQPSPAPSPSQGTTSDTNS